MPNHYKGGGSQPCLCFDSPIPPDLGASPSGGPMTRGYSPMVSPSDPFQPCGPNCSSGPCCQPGGGEGPGDFGPNGPSGPLGGGGVLFA